MIFLCFFKEKGEIHLRSISPFSILCRFGTLPRQITQHSEVVLVILLVLIVILILLILAVLILLVLLILAVLVVLLILVVVLLIIILHFKLRFFAERIGGS